MAVKISGITVIDDSRAITNATNYNGYTPLEQGGGVNMGSNKVRIGWRLDGSGLQAQVDGVPQGRIYTENQPPPATNVAAATAALGAGWVGTYAFASTSNTDLVDVGFGSLISGNRLFPISAVKLIIKSNNTAGFTAGGALSGTWRCMGFYDARATGGSSEDGEIDIRGATLWLRIS